MSNTSRENTISTRQISDKDEWENFLKQHSEANFLQSWLWGDFQEKMGKKIIRLGFFQDEKIVGTMLAVKEEAKRGTYLTVAGGPILNWKDQKLVETFVEKLRELSKENDCTFARVRPQLHENEYSTTLFSSYGFRISPMHLTADLTHQLDLTQTEEDLLKNMRKTSRNEIKKAINSGVRIEKTTDPEAINEFYEIQLQTAQLHKFVPFSHKFLREQFKTFADSNQAILYKSYHEDKLLALAFILFYGEEAVYHYGASTQWGREYPGAYLIQWEAIKEAKERGLKRYNFWGVAPEGQKEHRFYGVSVFKRGFGGQDVHYLRAHDLVVNPLKYKLNYLVEIIRKKRRNL
jgi:lipid II:glycine glycyltransferase (peptidoglycan interpeptide bridge formation enzyme)